MAEPTSILIVEDEPLIAMMLEDFIDSLGHRVAGTCDTLGEALRKVDQGGFDLAILDVHLDGETVWPLAERLRADKIPFILATGGHVDPPPAKFAQVMVIEKPYTMERVSAVIEAALASA